MGATYACLHVCSTASPRERGGLCARKWGLTPGNLLLQPAASPLPTHTTCTGSSEQRQCSPALFTLDPDRPSACRSQPPCVQTARPCNIAHIPTSLLALSNFQVSCSSTGASGGCAAERCDRSCRSSRKSSSSAGSHAHGASMTFASQASWRHKGRRGMPAGRLHAACRHLPAA